MLGWQEEVCRERGQRSRRGALGAWLTPGCGHLVAVSGSLLAQTLLQVSPGGMSSRCSCALPTQEWNLPFPSPEPSKEGGKVLVSPNHEAKCCCLEQFVHWIVPPCGEAPCAAPKTMEVPWRKAVLSALPSTTSGLGEGCLRNPSQAVPGAPVLHSGCHPRSVPAQATLICRCDDLRVASSCLAPSPPTTLGSGFLWSRWISPLVPHTKIPKMLLSPRRQNCAQAEPSFFMKKPRARAHPTR